MSENIFDETYPLRTRICGVLGIDPLSDDKALYGEIATMKLAMKNSVDAIYELGEETTRLEAERDALKARVDELEPVVLDGLKAETLLMILVKSLRGIPHDKIGNGSITKEITRDFLEFANRRLPEFGPLTSQSMRHPQPAPELSDYAKRMVAQAAKKPADQREGKR